MADICVASYHASLRELLADPEFASLANRDGFLIELRLDSYSDLSPELLDTAIAKFGPRAVVTYRHPAEGGKNSNAGDAERLKYLQQAANRGVRYVDIEARTPRAGFDKKQSKLILSYHDFEKCPSATDLILQFQHMRIESGVDVVKIACQPKDIHESARLLGMLLIIRAQNLLLSETNQHTPLIALGMGEAGFWTRVCAGMFQAPFTFARGEGAPGTAPGQPTWRELDEIYRFREITIEWPVYGVIGNPIGHSLSPLLHNTALKHLKRPGVYLPFKVEGDPAEFVRAFHGLDIRGLSVTIPHKEALQSLCAELDPVAAHIGAVNTLVHWTEGRWKGYNTDAFAAADSLEQAAGTLQNKTVLILGAGGAARAVAFGVKARGASVLIANRSADRATALADAVGGKVIQLNDIGNSKIDCVVNTTPLGMYPKIDDTPLLKDQIPQGSIVFDTVYNPRQTKLLKLAEERGCKMVDGLAMFVGQGLRQFELWTGQKPPRAEIEAVIAAELAKRQK